MTGFPKLRWFSWFNSPGPLIARFSANWRRGAAFLSIGGCGLGVIILFALLSKWNEPTLTGKRLHVWRKEFETTGTFGREVDRAGTNAIPFLIRAANTPPPIYERIYVRVWGFWFRKAPRPLQRLLPSPGSVINRREVFRRVVILKLARLGQDSSQAMEALIRLLQTGDRFAVIITVEALNRLGPRAETATPALIELLERSSSDLGLSVVRALGNIAPRKPDVVGALSLSLERSPEVAVAAARVLKTQKLEQDRVIAALTRLLKGEATSAWDAAHLLGQYGAAAKSALPELIEMLRVPDKRLRRKAAITLGQIGPSASGAELALRDALQDNDLPIREAVGAALTKIAGQP